jgi:hypothetical protein
VASSHVVTHAEQTPDLHHPRRRNLLLKALVESGCDGVVLPRNEKVVGSIPRTSQRRPARQTYAGSGLGPCPVPTTRATSRTRGLRRDLRPRSRTPVGGIRAAARLGGLPTVPDLSVRAVELGFLVLKLLTSTKRHDRSCSLVIALPPTVPSALRTTRQPGERSPAGLSNQVDSDSPDRRDRQWRGAPVAVRDVGWMSDSNV